MTNFDWPFDQPPNCAVFTVASIFRHGAPILHVFHDADDHGWQFLCEDGASMSDALVVALEEIVKRDPSVLEVADMPPGWHAWRESHQSPWQQEPIADGAREQ